MTKKNYINYTEFLTPEELEEQKDEIALNQLRQARIELLHQYDIWEIKVLRGAEEDTKEVQEWHQNLLDLAPEAFDNIPEDVSKYE